VNLWHIRYTAMDAASVTLSELSTAVALDVDPTVLARLGPPVDAVVVDDGSPPFSKRVTTRCECRACRRVLARYTGGLRLTMAHPRYAGREVHFADGVFVFACQNPQCEVPAKLWPELRLAVELRRAWDAGRRRFVVT
jgi:hypothetical protein